MIQVRLDERAQQFFAATAPNAEQMIEAEVARQTQGLLGTAQTSTFLQESANAQSLVTRGLSADYTSHVDGWVFGAALSVAADPGSEGLNLVSQNTNTSFDTAVPVAAGAQLSLMVGYNLADAGLPDLTIFAHGMAAPLSFSEFSGNFFNLGVSGQYQLVSAVGNPNKASWGGIAITSGLEYSRMRLSVVDDGVALSTSVAGVRITSDSAAGISLTQRAFNVPVELTTNVTLAHVLTVFGGVGLDFSAGQAELTANLDSNLDASAAGGSQDAGTVEIDVDDRATADPVAFRLLGGAQFNMGGFHLFAQANFRPEQGTVSGAGGLRITF